MITRPALCSGGALLSVLLAGCQDGAPAAGRPGPFAGANGAAAASDFTRAANATTAGSVATGAPGSAMARATTFVIATHQASERQRQVAIQRARVTVAKLTTPTPGSPKPRLKKVPRYFAVETVRDQHTSPLAKKAVMIWDTQAQEMVGNNVYDISQAPAVGTLSRFETYSAEYVGAGL